MKPTALALLVAALLVLSACGGGDGEETNTSAQSAAQKQTAKQDELEVEGQRPARREPTVGALATEGGTASAAEAAGEPQGKASPGASPGSAEAGSGGKDRRRKAYERNRFGEPSAQSQPFAKYSGPASEGKLHLAEYGEEAGARERGEVSAVLSAYLAAAAAEHWGDACGYLAREVKAQIRRGIPGEGCAEELPAAIRIFDANGSQLVAPAAGVLSLRIKQGGGAGDGAGFALFHAVDGKDYWMAVRVDGGAWRVLSATAQPFR